MEISRRTLFAYRKSDPREAPEGFDSVDDWAQFILERQVYEPGRTQAPEKREAKERRAMSRNGGQQARRNLANGDSDAEKYSAPAERKERIIRLRLGNDCRRAELAVLRRESIPVSECLESFAVVAARTRAVLLEKAIAKSLEALSRPEAYFKSETEHGANGVGPVSGG